MLTWTPSLSCHCMSSWPSLGTTACHVSCKQPQARASSQQLHECLVIAMAAYMAGFKNDLNDVQLTQHHELYTAIRPLAKRFLQ